MTGLARRWAWPSGSGSWRVRIRAGSAAALLSLVGMSAFGGEPKSVPVLYACVRVLPAVPCWPCEHDCQLLFPGEWRDAPECKGCSDLSHQPFYGCHDQPAVEHEFRSRMEEPLACHEAGCCEGGPCLCSAPRGLVCETRQPFTDGDWQCRPVMEFQAVQP